MKDRPWRGSFAIPMTPFDAHDRIDEDLLRAEIEFCIQSGVGGLVVPVMVSEFWCFPKTNASSWCASRWRPARAGCRWWPTAPP